MNKHVQIRENIDEIYSHTREHITPQVWEEIIASWPDRIGLDAFPDMVAARMGEGSFIGDLARLEWTVRCVENSDVRPPSEGTGMSINPSLTLLDLSWKHLPLFLEGVVAPERGNEFVLVYRNPWTSHIVSESASDGDLLALKLLADNVSPKEAAVQENVSMSVLERALDRAIGKGILFAGASRIQRDFLDFDIATGGLEAFFSASVFTLQWHITQACDLHCRHCYDRTDRHALQLPGALGILDDFHDFCRSRNVSGHISFSGGNPLLYPQFTNLYKAASNLGFSLAILGNPAPRRRMEELKTIELPAFYQVSLEGMPEHNDKMRGPGHFDRIMEFLGVLGDLGIYSMVMLTLTSDNFKQVLPLAEFLRGKVDLFTFNRLSMVGEGANLHLPSKGEYLSFLEEYLDAAKDNPILSLKDNLLNILLKKSGSELFGGCAGYGCGAAFNFLSILPDGEAHACRKFPSPVGNVLSDGIAGVYDSEEARKYRSGSRACGSCSIRPVCGGCLAVAHGFGLDIFEERDPFCFMEAISS